jgi:hypothetical protein
MKDIKCDWNAKKNQIGYIENRPFYDASQELDLSNVIDGYDYSSEWGFAKVSDNPDDFVVYDNVEYYYINFLGGKEGRMEEIGYQDGNLLLNICPDGTSSSESTIVAIVRSGDCGVMYGGHYYPLPLTPGIWVRRDPVQGNILYSVYSKDVHPIPEKYLPDSVKPFVVNIIESENESGEPVYSADKTFEEIVAAHEAGKDVYALYLNVKCPLVYRDDMTIEFSQAHHFPIDPVMLGVGVGIIAINVSGEVFLEMMDYPLASTRITPIIPPGIQVG